MNIYLLVILGSLLLGYGITLVTGILNLRHLRPDLPAEFEGVFDPEKYRKSQLYTRDSIRLELVSSGIELAILLAFLLLGGFNQLDLLVRELELPFLAQGLVYIGTLFVVADLLGTPFELYRIFVLEERYGFNRMTSKTYLLDKIKSYFLVLLIGTPLLTAILFFFNQGQAWAWVACWFLFVSLILAVQYLAPRFILPLFNRFTPLEPGSLRESLEQFAKKQGFELEGIFVIDGSKRSTKSNAFFAGFGKHKRIALYDTLVNNHTTREIVAILAHEIGHYKLGHVRKNIALVAAKSGLLFLLLSLFIHHGPLYQAFGMQHEPVYAGLIFFFLLYTPVSLLTGILFNALSRRFEYQADRFAASSTGKPEALVAALKKLAVKNLSNLTPHPWYSFVHYSHPPVLRRIQALRTV